MKKALPLTLVVLSLSGCSSIKTWWANEETTASHTNGNSTPKCKINLSNRDTYWSRFEGESIYLYDRSGRKCLLRKLSAKTKPIYSHNIKGEQSERVIANNQ
jgi:uncharacterized protein YceK